MADITAWLSWLIQQLPLTWFVFVGSFIDELFPPTPSPLIMSSAGMLAKEQGQTVLFFLLLAALSAMAKTLGGLILYFFGDIGEDVVAKYLRWWPHSAKEQRLGLRGSLILISLRTIPVVPSFTISLICGVIKTSLPGFIITTFIGSFLRGALLLWLGFSGSSLVTTVLATFRQ